MDDVIRSAERASAMAPLNERDARHLLRVDRFNLEALWTLHRLYPTDSEWAERLCDALRPGQPDSVKVECFAVAGYYFPQLIYPDGSKLIELGEFEVDSDQSLTSKLEQCGFAAKRTPETPDSCSRITQERFPFQQKGKKKVRLALINNRKGGQYEQDFVGMAQRVSRELCDHAHGLAVAHRYPDIQCELAYIMFGARDPRNGQPAVLVFDGCRKYGRWFDYCGVDSVWVDGGWAVVAG